MDELPINTRHPVVRDYLALIRLQVLTPLSLLLNIAATAICAFVVHPTLSEVLRLHPTPLSPRPVMIGIYIAALFLLEIGYCVLLVVARKKETKQAITKACGMPIVLGNFILGLAFVFWTLQFFIPSTIFLCLLLLVLTYANIRLIVSYPPTGERPLDTAFIHAPARLFLIFPLMIGVPVALFIALGLTSRKFSPYPSPSYPYPWPPSTSNLSPSSSVVSTSFDSYIKDNNTETAELAALGVSIGTNLIASLVIALRRDIVWCVAATWLCVSIWSERGRPVGVEATTITFTVLHPLFLIVSLLWSWFGNRRSQGRIVLPADEEDEEVARVRNRPRPDATHTTSDQRRRDSERDNADGQIIWD